MLLDVSPILLQHQASVALHQVNVINTGRSLSTVFNVDVQGVVGGDAPDPCWIGMKLLSIVAGLLSWCLLFCRTQRTALPTSVRQLCGLPGPREQNRTGDGHAMIHSSRQGRAKSSEEIELSLSI